MNKFPWVFPPVSELLAMNPRPCQICNTMFDVDSNNQSSILCWSCKDKFKFDIPKGVDLYDTTTIRCP